MLPGPAQGFACHPGSAEGVASVLAIEDFQFQLLGGSQGEPPLFAKVYLHDRAGAVRSQPGCRLGVPVTFSRRANGHGGGPSLRGAVAAGCGGGDVAIRVGQRFGEQQRLPRHPDCHAWPAPALGLQPTFGEQARLATTPREKLTGTPRTGCPSRFRGMPTGMVAARLCEERWRGGCGGGDVAIRVGATVRRAATVAPRPRLPRLACTGAGATTGLSGSTPGSR
jgi:hypothetical protein